ncbi:MAG: ATP-binding protein [Bdellovibrionales bacterium]|nr:ATP-binding protein [Bdellovibrionales bacterium]
MLVKRHLQQILKKSRKSILLLGPRQTGKSTLMKELRPDLTINLADEESFVSHLRDPGLLRRRLGAARTILIDEVQRIPSLLNTVQAIIDEDKSRRFLLTGSSARKLRRGNANLLPGRVLSYTLSPLAPSELGSRFEVAHALSVGLLPEPTLMKSTHDAHKLLSSYARTYLKEEIQAESLTRNLEGFARFLEVAAERSGQFVDLSKWASQASIERTSARRYFEILADTLIVEPIEPFAKSGHRRLIQHPRYYFFDVGVLNGLLGNFTISGDRRGPLLENLLLQCILSEMRARDQTLRISVYRTEAGAEVDFVIETGKRLIALECKASKNIGSSDLRGLNSFRDYVGRSCECLVAYLGQHPQTFDKGAIEVLPFAQAVARIKAA